MPQLSALATVGGLAVAGYYAGQFVKRVSLPSILGAMIFGVVLGPSLLGWLTEDTMLSLSFLSQVTLALVAFSIGSELRYSVVKRLGLSIVLIILCESFFAFIFTTLLLWWLTGDLAMAVIFGSMAPASAPAGTVAVIQEFKAKGPLTTALYAVVGFDDGLAILIYAFAAAFARDLLIRETTGAAASDIVATLAVPVKEIIISTVIGLVLGWLMSVLVGRLREGSDIMTIMVGFVLLAGGLALTYHASLILTTLIVGLVFTNLQTQTVSHKVAQQYMAIMPLFFVLFFTLAGAHLHVAALPALGAVGLVYIIGRSSGLLSGAWFGAVIGKSDDVIRKWLGLGILSQAGVAIGLALIVSQDFATIGTEHAIRVGASVLTTVTATSIFFEVIGPILTKVALTKAKEIGAATGRPAEA